MRKGRFDEVFFIDLPTQQAREQILGIHLSRKHREPQQFNLKLLAEAAADFTGSELEQVVISALFNAFQKQEELADDHILEEIKKTRPLAVLNAEQIDSLRRWAADRCVSAD
jgi:SpoVK/Ycf46/Vps4 family AAA+-type ATPase